MAKTQAAPGPAGTAEVEAFLRRMDDPRKPLLLALRRTILGADRRIAEGIKWNAPSFFHRDWFATMNLRGTEGVMLVLHMGAKAKASARTGLPIDDPDGLLTWPAKDRALVTFRNRNDLTTRRGALRAIIGQWVAVMEGS